MAAFDFSPTQAAASIAEGQQASVPIQSLLMQIDADAVFGQNAVSAGNVTVTITPRPSARFSARTLPP